MANEWSPITTARPSNDNRGPIRRSTQKRRHVLVVEDEPGEALLLEELIQSQGVDVKVVDNGHEALAYVGRRSPFQNAERPDLIVLDLRLPRMSGKDVLTALKSNVATRTIPTVVFSSINFANYIAEIYDLGANSYICKPPELDSYRARVEAMTEFWMTSCIMPP